MRFCVLTEDNHWNSQKLSMEKNTVGSEPYIKEVTVTGGFFVFPKTGLLPNIPKFIVETSGDLIVNCLY